MSTSLYWRPKPKEPKDTYLGYRIKYYLSKKLWGHDGSLVGEWTTVDKSWIPYLKGVNDATDDKELTEEIEKLFELLDKYGEIEVSLMS